MPGTAYRCPELSPVENYTGYVGLHHILHAWRSLPIRGRDHHYYHQLLHCDPPPTPQDCLAGLILELQSREHRRPRDGLLCWNELRTQFEAEDRSRTRRIPVTRTEHGMTNTVITRDGEGSFDTKGDGNSDNSMRNVSPTHSGTRQQEQHLPKGGIHAQHQHNVYGYWRAREIVEWLESSSTRSGMCKHLASGSNFPRDPVITHM